MAKPIRLLTRATNGAVERSKIWLDHVQRSTAWRQLRLAYGIDDGSSRDGAQHGVNDPIHDRGHIQDANGQGPTRPRPHDYPQFLQFFVSKYALVLVILSFVINRIHNLVPPRIPYRTSYRVRALVRGPAILLLLRSCIRLLAMVVQMSDSADVTGTGNYTLLRNSILGESTKHADVLWGCFISASVACAAESFTRALDHDLQAIAPMNLFTLGLLLSYHSTPTNDPLVPPTRAVYLLLFLTLAEVLVLHIAAIPAWRIRLWITGTFAVLSRGTMIYLWTSASEKGHTDALMPAIQSLGRILPEAFFVTCSVVTITLRALVQLLTEGRLSKDIFGHSSALPHRDDDFVLAIIKYGAATLEATAMKGLNNEVSALSQPRTTYVELHRSSNSTSASSSTGNGHVFLTNPAYPTIPQLAVPKNAFGYEVRNIKALPGMPTDVDPMSRSPSMRREIVRFCKALWLLWKVSVVQPLSDIMGVRRLAAGQSKSAHFLRFLGVLSPNVSGGGVAQELHRLVSAGCAKTATSATALDADDDEDADFCPSDDEVSNDGSSSENSDSSYEGERHARLQQLPASEYERENTPGPGEELVYLLQQQEQADLSSVLIAHLQAGTSSSSPLTRRRYRAMLQPPVPDMSTGHPDSALTTAIAVRRSRHFSPTGGGTARDSWDEANFRSPSMCVVCCADQRSVVLWPCRCLALCNDCRAELASRSSMAGGSNLCPCCRTEVQGFSRIHIP